MSMPQPPQIAAASTQLDALLERAEQKKVDVVATPWADLERSVHKVLGGAFRGDTQEHQVVALGLAAAFAARLKDTGAFWFPSREAAEGAALGFPEALITLSPFGAVAEALGGSNLSKLETIEKDVRTALAQVKASATANASGMQLGPEAYVRLFDPGFVQLVSVDDAAAKAAWGKAPQDLSRDLRGAVSRAAELPEEVRAQLEQQLAGSLARLKADSPLIEQAAAAPRVAEQMGVLFGGGVATGSAPEEFWSEVVMPLLFIGAPQTFPALKEDALELARQGIAALLLFIDAAPYQFREPIEGGLLGVFDGSSLALPDPGFQQVTNLRLIKVNLEALKAPLAAFDEQKTRDAVSRFAQHLAKELGEAAPAEAEETAQLLGSALALLSDVKAVAAVGKDVYLRRLTEAEAAAEPALALVRQALTAPKLLPSN